MAERKRNDASVLGNLPPSRPQRRSPRRSPNTTPSVQPPQPAGAPPAPGPGVEERRRELPREHVGDAPARGDGGEGAQPSYLATAVQATGELASIGAGVASRVVRGALDRLPGR